MVVFRDIPSCSLADGPPNRANGHYTSVCVLSGFCRTLLSKHRNVHIESKVAYVWNRPNELTPSFGNTHVFKMFIFQCQKKCWPAYEQINVLTCEKIQILAPRCECRFKNTSGIPHPVSFTKDTIGISQWTFTNSELGVRINKYLQETFYRSDNRLLNTGHKRLRLTSETH